MNTGGMGGGGKQMKALPLSQVLSFFLMAPHSRGCSCLCLCLPVSLYRFVANSHLKGLTVRFQNIIMEYQRQFNLMDPRVKHCYTIF